MAKNKVNGFLVALIIAIVSFFVIFFFFPGASDKFFGVSLKNGNTDVTKLKKKAETVTERVTEKVTDTIGDDIKSLISGN